MSTGVNAPAPRGSGRTGGTGRARSRTVPSPRTGPRPAARPARPSRRTAHRRGWLVCTALAGTLVSVAALVWVLLGGPLFDARSVQVIGTVELPADEVRVAAAVPLGTPLLRLDTGEVEARVAALPRVAAVQVSRTLGGTVRIAVTERSPVAVQSAPDGVHLIDVTGTSYAKVADAPAGLPQLRVAQVGPADSATLAAITVLTGLPEPLRIQVLSVAADSPADVLLRLGEEREVHWGGVEAGERKAAVLGVLLTQPGRIYDVSSPDLPTIS